MQSQSGAAPDENQWLTDLRNSPFWNNLLALSRFISVLTARGAAAVSGIKDCKKNILLARKIIIAKETMRPEDLNHCGYDSPSPSER